MGNQRGRSSNQPAERAFLELGWRAAPRNANQGKSREKHDTAHALQMSLREILAFSE
jgi:hypothetical protein